MDMLFAFLLRSVFRAAVNQAISDAAAVAAHAYRRFWRIGRRTRQGALNGICFGDTPYGCIAVLVIKRSRFKIWLREFRGDPGCLRPDGMPSPVDDAPRKAVAILTTKAGLPSEAISCRKMARDLQGDRHNQPSLP
jgi:hypothetical protein